MFIEILKDILFGCSCVCILTTPLAIILLLSQYKLKKNPSRDVDGVVSFKKWDVIEKYIAITIIVSGTLGPIYIPFSFFGCGNTNIGSLFEKARYTEDYYVYMRTDDSHSSSYKLEATIRRDKYGNDEHDFDGYYIEELHLDNGTIITFLDKEREPHPTDELEPFKEKGIEAHDGETYYITLTKEKVPNHKNINNTERNDSPKPDNETISAEEPSGNTYDNEQSTISKVDISGIIAEATTENIPSGARLRYDKGANNEEYDEGYADGKYDAAHYAYDYLYDEYGIDDDGIIDYIAFCTSP